MFQKPAFGSNTPGFGSFNPGASTSFGAFKSTTGTSAFGAPPAFGAATSTQPAASGGLFGATNTTGGLFGSTTASTSAPAFGASTSGFGFGANTSTGGLFANNTSSGLFGSSQNTSAFGAKPAGFGFGSTSTTGTTGGLFGTTATTGTGLFGQQNTTLGGGGLFSNTTGAFGQQQSATGTAHVKYNPVVGTDTLVKSGTTQNISIKHHCITCMKEYENKSLEELRLEDYVAGRKGNTAGVFGGFQQPTENKPLFGGNTFGQPATTSAPSMFGGGGLGTTPGFGQTSTFSFGGNTQNQTNTTSLFGANKPAFGATGTTGTGLFGATTTQTSTFGTPTSTFGFGTNTQNQSGGLFGVKPTTTGFGTTPATSGFGATPFGGGGLFGAKTQQSTAPSFGTATPAFGGLSAGFGTNTSTSTGIFGANSTFGKPATSQPTFGFGNTQTAPLGTGLGTGLGANTLQAKPAPMFQNLQFPQFSSTFKTGQENTLGGGLFGTNTTLGAAPTLGAFNANTSALTSNNLGSSLGGNVHEQILTLAARPYGDSPLFKDLQPDSSTTTEDVLKPTNPAAVKAILDSSVASSYRVTSPTAGRLKVLPRSLALPHDKKSLFDGLEESDASLEDKLSLKPSRKRLVLRPNQRSETHNSEREQEQLANHTGRSSDEADSQHITNGSAQVPRERIISVEINRDDNDEQGRKSADYTDSKDLEIISNRQGSWLSPPLPWSEKEKPIDGEPTPRLYPNLDKELPPQVSDRRASWLTTKPLRKPLVSNPDSIENSVRELGMRLDHTVHDKENIDNLSVSEEENVAPREAPPHPTGVKLTRPGYYTIPTLDEMISYMNPDGSCVVPHLTIGRRNYGNVYYECEIDVAGLDLDALVHFLNKEVIVYPEDADKPPVGQGLNRRAIVTLDRIWPRDKTEKRPITDPDRLLKMDYEGKLRRVCDKHDTKFIEYRPQTGSWVFKVEHFSKYGLTDSDEEDDPTPDVIKRQLVDQPLQKSAPPIPNQSVPVPTQGLGGLGAEGLLSQDSTLFSMQQSSLNLFNGSSKALEMDTTEDNAESTSLYQDNRDFGVKSPTSELARLEHRRSHSVQLMKASLYADADMEDNVSLSTGEGDQMVPRAASVLSVSLARAPTCHEPIDIEEETVPLPTPLTIEEIQMKPLIVRPQTIVLRYHRKVPPFRNTIAGRLDASCIADMSVCRARHSRIGFGPAGTLVYATSYDAVSDLPKTADLCDLGRYVGGRSEDDWSEPIVTRLALGQADNANLLQDTLFRHLEALLELSIASSGGEDLCPRLSVRESPTDRLELLRRYLRDSEQLKGHKAQFGVTGAYWHEVWALCNALWGADLENDGIPGTDELSIVDRHRKLLDWMNSAVADVTDTDLAKARAGEPEDEADGHSSRVWTLLLGGRILEACKVARDNGDLNMAIMIAQASGDETFRSLVTRQLSLWRECGALDLISRHRRAALKLIAGQTYPRDELIQLDWLRTLHATARYLCPQVPSLERIVRMYEGFFTKGDISEEDREELVDLTVIEEGETEMKYPLPPYVDEYDVTVTMNGKPRRLLDLRYELIRARAFNGRPKLQPAAYTPDPLDYSLCFLLGTWFGNPTVESITGVADQLEACGAWHLAIQALAYHPDDIARGHLIRGVLSRHAPSRANTPEQSSRLQLVRRLKVPEKWLLLAQAHRAKYERLPAIEAQHLVGACQWNAAHKVLLEELLPEAVLADDLQSISPLLEKMSEAAGRYEVSGWESGGQALYHYLHVCEEIRKLVSSESKVSRSEVQARLEALRPRVAAACRALGYLHTKSARHAFARAEMGSRLVQLSLAAGEPAHHLAALLRALKLPPDCTAHAQYKITTELADAASDSCTETVSSPLSSHQRVTAQN